MQDGRIDAFFWSGGLGTAAIKELSSAPGVRLRFLDTAAVVPALREAHGPLYAASVLPAGSYGSSTDVPVSAVPNLLLVGESMDEQLVHELARVLFEALPELAVAHPEARSISLEKAASGEFVSYHPGAERFYRERGAWKR